MPHRRSPAPAPVVERAQPGSGPWFAQDLGRFADRVALVDSEEGPVTYRELEQRAGDVATVLGPTRRLVVLRAERTVDAVAAYLGALCGRHPVILVGDEDHLAIVVDRYDPDVVVRPTGGDLGLVARRSGSAHQLHEDLALLLSTSGTTGSPKLVRLSQRNLQTNAEAIAGYLGLTPADRAPTTLPLHYCYGLSVLHSHLLVGASVVLTDRSVVDPCFWRAFQEQQATSLAGVPHTFDLLDRIGFDAMDLPRLRHVTQAGGRLAPDRVRRYARLGVERGWRFFVMYGQTEATARMAFLPPALAVDEPGSIGVPIPGGSFEIDRPDDRGVGELCYRGPNVMLGYAEAPVDLRRGRTVHMLRTGDLARRTPSGCYELVGRTRRFVKLFGLRVDLDRLEDLLRGEGHDVLCTGDDRRLVVGVRQPADLDDVARLVVDKTQVPRGAVVVVGFEELPRTSSGKPDYPKLLAAVGHGGCGAEGRESWRQSTGNRASCSPGSRPMAGRGAITAAAACAASPASGPAPAASAVRDAFAPLGPPERLTGDASFVSLGGDSLSYVEVSLRLEEALGHLPAGWHLRPIAELEGLRARRRRWPAIETSVVLRALAIVAVVGSHAGAFTILGGAHVLLAVAGWNFARFALPATPGTWWPRMARAVGRVAVPTVLFTAVLWVLVDEVAIGNVVLANNYLADGRWRYWYWFVEVLAQLLVVAAVAFGVPLVRRAERRAPYAFALALLVPAVALRLVRIGDPANDLYRTHCVAWLFVLGWAAQRATTTRQRLVVTVAAVVSIVPFFAGVERAVVVVVGVLALVWTTQLRLPVTARRLAGLLAAASLWIYLTHWQVFPLLARVAPPWAVTVGSLVVGVAAWWLQGRVRRAGPSTVSRWATVRSRRPSRAGLRFRSGARRDRPARGLAAEAGVVRVSG